MKLSLRAEYALRALIALGNSSDADVVPMQVVSRQQEIPKRFLEQILNDLRAGGFVDSKRGVAGGYRLASPMDEIKVADVIRHMEGTLPDKTCRSGKPPKLNPIARGACLAIQAVMKDANNALAKILDSVTIDDLFSSSRQFQGESDSLLDYTI